MSAKRAAIQWSAVVGALALLVTVANQCGFRLMTEAQVREAIAASKDASAEAVVTTSSTPEICEDCKRYLRDVLGTCGKARGDHQHLDRDFRKLLEDRHRGELAP